MHMRCSREYRDYVLWVWAATGPGLFFTGKSISTSYHAQHTTLIWVYLDFPARHSMLYPCSDVLRLFTTWTMKFDFRFRIGRQSLNISKWMIDIGLTITSWIYLSFSLIIMAGSVVIIKIWFTNYSRTNLIYNILLNWKLFLQRM